MKPNTWTEDQSRTWAKLLRDQMTSRDMSVEAFALLTGFQTEQVVMWLSGGRRPNRTSCVRVARALELDPNILLEVGGYRPLSQDAPVPDVNETNREYLMRLASRVPVSELNLITEFMEWRVERARKNRPVIVANDSEETNGNDRPDFQPLREALSSARVETCKAIAGEASDLNTVAGLIDGVLEALCPHDPEGHSRSTSESGEPLVTCLDCGVSWHKGRRFGGDASQT